jgi:hypothetical protein
MFTKNFQVSAAQLNQAFFGKSNRAGISKLHRFHPFRRARVAELHSERKEH